jgi:hypothetical protein
MTPLSKTEASAIWAVLVGHAGASTDPFDRENFVHHQTSDQPPTEWRFQGGLGFGGKFRRQRVWVGDQLREAWFVDCYPEDATPDRQAAIDTTNAALAELQKERTT